jgi:hypothetical protein
LEGLIVKEQKNLQEEIIMKKNSKHKKQQGLTHPISVSERIEEILERAANNPKSIYVIRGSKKLRKLFLPDGTEGAHTISIRPEGRHIF